MAREEREVGVTPVVICVLLFHILEVGVTPVVIFVLLFHIHGCEYSVKI